MYYYIINPASGGGRINKIQQRLKDRLGELGIAGEFEKSVGPGDVTKLTKHGIEKGYKTIVAVGGDGTINEVINGLEDNEKVAVGIIPIGDSNELAKTLGIPDWQKACNILAARKVEKVDLGKVDGNFFVTSVNIGFEAKTNSTKQEAKKFLNKIRGYKDSLMWATKYKPQEATINFDNNFVVETNFFNIQVSNSQFASYLPRKISPQDNLLDISIVSKMSVSNIIKYISSPSSLNEESSAKVSVFRANRVSIKTKKPMDVSVDGRIITKTPIVCTLADKKLSVIVSKKRKF